MMKGHSIGQAMSATRRGSRYVFGFLLAFLSLWSASQCLSFGMARLYEARAVAGDDLSAANEAVLAAPEDPEAYRVRAGVLLGQQRLGEAITDLKQAVALAPLNYQTWVELGDARKRQGDTRAALAAYSQATRLAPRYAHPHWLLGNCLLKAGRPAEAFVELRRGTMNNPALYFELIELAWSTSGGDPQFVLGVSHPQTTQERLALSAFFFRRGKTDAANALVREIDHISEDDRLSLLSELIASRRFADAREIWLQQRPSGTDRDGAEQMTDGGFENEVIIDDPGFGWQFQQHEKTVSAILDRRDPRRGAQSLRLNWKGQSDPSTPLFDQLVLVKPASRYRLRFAVRVAGLTTGGLPFVAVVEAMGNVTQSAEAGRVVARSQPIRPEVLSWQEYSVEFATGAATRAVYILVRRENCADQPCPIFGDAWFDDFNLMTLS
jgi:Tetratricopeptide repeat